MEMDQSYNRSPRRQADWTVLVTVNRMVLIEIQPNRHFQAQDEQRAIFCNGSG